MSVLLIIRLGVISLLIDSDDDFWTGRVWRPAHDVLLDAASRRERNLNDRAEIDGWIDQTWDEIGVELFQIKAMGALHPDQREMAEATCSSVCEPLQQLRKEVESATRCSTHTVLERYQAAEAGWEAITSELYSLCSKRADMEMSIYGDIGTAPQPSGEWLTQLTGSNGTFIDELIRKQCTVKELAISYT